MAQSKLHKIGLKHETDKATHHQYLDFYAQHLPKDFRGRLLEIGVMDGNSLRMWAEYYPNAEIIGIDIKTPRNLNLPNVTWLQLDVTNTKEVLKLGKFDVIIDDGSHMTSQQQLALKTLMPQVNRGGVFIMEDLHTSFMPNYIDTEITTYNLLKQQKGWIFYQRTKDLTDSVTALKKV